MLRDPSLARLAYSPQLSALSCVGLLDALITPSPVFLSEYRSAISSLIRKVQLGGRRTFHRFRSPIITRRRLDAGVTHQLCDRHDVHALVEHITGKCPPKVVRLEVCTPACAAGGISHSSISASCAAHPLRHPAACPLHANHCA